MQCDIASAITNTSSEAYTVFSEDMKEMEDKNLTAVRIPWWVPTAEAKTFHPRSLGQKAFKDAIMAAW